MGGYSAGGWEWGADIQAGGGYSAGGWGLWADIQLGGGGIWGRILSWGWGLGADIQLKGGAGGEYSAGGRGDLGGGY